MRPPRLELYCISITLYMRVFIPPELAPLLHRDHSGQTIAQQGAFTPICHRLSPFVLPDKQNAGSRLPPLSHLALVTHGISCSLLLMGSVLAGSFFFFLNLELLGSTLRAGVDERLKYSPRLITSFQLILILEHVSDALLMVCLSWCMRC